MELGGVRWATYSFNSKCDHVKPFLQELWQLTVGQYERYVRPAEVDKLERLGLKKGET